jgi:hypothetical protein
LILDKKKLLRPNQNTKFCGGKKSGFAYSEMRVLLENTTFLLHKIVRIAGIIRVASIIRGRSLYEEIRYPDSILFRH